MTDPQLRDSRDSQNEKKNKKLNRMTDVDTIASVDAESSRKYDHVTSISFCL